MSETTAKPYGEQTVAELRTVAKLAGVTGYSRMKRGDLLNAILEWERAAVAVADRPVSFPEPSPTDVAIEEAFPKVGDITPDGVISEASRMSDGSAYVSYAEEEQGLVDGKLESLSDEGKKSLSKAALFLEAAARLGWTPEKQGTQDPAHYGVTVARGSERIEIEWDRGVFQGDTCYYSHSARTPIKLRNASHAKKVMAIPAATADEEARKVSAHKVTRPTRKTQAETISAGRKALPFDPETATDDEVLVAVANRSISWTNEISGAIEDAYVHSSLLRVQAGRSGRSITFTSATGYRSVRVSSIVAVR